MEPPLRPRWQEEPAPTRLDPAHPHREAILDRHGAAMRAGLSSYVDPVTRFTVLTAGYLAERGYCCNAGCRHCPYVGA